MFTLLSGIFLLIFLSVLSVFSKIDIFFNLGTYQSQQKRRKELVLQLLDDLGPIYEEFGYSRYSLFPLTYPKKLNKYITYDEFKELLFNKGIIKQDTTMKYILSWPYLLSNISKDIDIIAVMENSTAASKLIEENLEYRDDIPI